MKVLEFCSAFLLFTLVFEVSQSNAFGYHNADQRRWKRRHSGCGGHMQSPISITTRKAIPLRMPALEMVGYHNSLPGPIKFHNNGHSVSLSVAKYDPGAGPVDKLPYIFGGKLENEYELEGLHFHWGDKNNRGSEHVLNDIRYPMEMHIIHRNKKYANTPEAIQYADGLTVLAFFYQIRDEEAKELNPLVKNLTQIEEYNTSMILNATFTLSSLLPVNMDRFYTYKGSLTTPPCSEAVTWILFPDLLPISVYQMEKFRLLSSNAESMLVDNYRHVQPLYGRRVFVRAVNGNSAKFFKYNNVHYSKWDWLGPEAFEYPPEEENEISDDDEGDFK